MRVLNSVEATEAASRTEVTPEFLTQRAGYAIAQFCVAQFKFRSVCVVCGTGKNGSAGLAAATVLERIAEKIWVLVLTERAGKLDPGSSADLPQSLRPIWIRDEADFETDATREALGADLIIDAIIGTGYRPPLRPLAGAAVTAINNASGTVVSVDVPSGVDADSREPLRLSCGNRVFAHAVIALGATKPAHVFGDLAAGPIAISELGTQPAFTSNGRLSVLTGQDVCLAFPSRPRGAPERDFGHVLVVGGARGRSGVAALAGLVAMRAGTGRVTIACPRSVEARIAGFGTAALFTHGLPETDAGSIAMAASGEIDALLAGKDAVVLGPGLSVNAETAAFARRFVERCPLPVIIDGDGVAAFAGRYGDLRLAADGGQFRVLCTTSDVLGADRSESARSISSQTGACVVIKGSHTVIAGLSGETWLNLSGGPAMAKAGMGEILAGLMAAALAGHLDHKAPMQQSNPPFHVQFWRDLKIAAAVHLQGVAADLARDALHEHTLVAADLLDALSAAFRACDLQVERGLYYLRS